MIQLTEEEFQGLKDQLAGSAEVIRQTDEALQKSVECVRAQRTALQAERERIAELLADLHTLVGVFGQIEALTQGSVTKAIGFMSNPSKLSDIVKPAYEVVSKYQS